MYVIMMRPTPQKSRNIKGKGSNWMFVAGGALLSSLSIHIGYKLKQALEAKQQDKSTPEGNGNSPDRRRTRIHHSQPSVYNYGPDEDSCFNYNSGAEGMVERKNPPNSQIVCEPEDSLSLVTVPGPEYHQENSNIWVSSPERIELPRKRFQHSNSSDSPCASDSGSDILSKREVIQKLRQQLKRRDDMILEMQDQIAGFQNALNRQVSHSNHLQTQLDAANRDLFDSDREIQRLRKAIADHCVGNVEGSNGYTNGNCNSNVSEKSESESEGEKIERLKRDIGEMKDVIEGKEFLVQSYKEEKSELSIKIRELQQRLDSQLPNIL